MKKTLPTRQSRRAVALGSMETPIITGTAAMIQTSWR
jgi:hypothetical protein